MPSKAQMNNVVPRKKLPDPIEPTFTPAQNTENYPIDNISYDEEEVVSQYPNINFERLALELSREMNKGLSTGLLAPFFRSRRIRLKSEQLDLISGYIQRLDAVNTQALQMQFQLTINPDVLKNMVNGYYVESQRLADKQLHEHQLEMLKLKSEMHDIDMARKRSLLEHDHIANLNEQEITRLALENANAKVKTSLLEAIIKELDFKNITSSQAFVLQTALQNGNPVEFNAGIHEEMLEKMKAETALKNAEAKEKQYKADQEGHTSRLRKARTDEEIDEIKAGEVKRPGGR